MSIENSITHDLYTSLNQSFLTDFEGSATLPLAYLEKNIYRVAHVGLAVLAIIEYSLKFCLCLGAYSFSIITTPFEFIIMKIYSIFEHSEVIDLVSEQSSTPISSRIYDFANYLSINNADALLTFEAARHYLMFGNKHPYF